MDGGQLPLGHLEERRQKDWTEAGDGEPWKHKLHRRLAKHRA